MAHTAKNLPEPPAKETKSTKGLNEIIFVEEKDLCSRYIYFRLSIRKILLGCLQHTLSFRLVLRSRAPSSPPFGIT